MFVIDRIEGSWAVIEYWEEGVTFNIPVKLLPPDAREGDIILLEVAVDREATEKVKNSVDQFLDGHMEDK